MKQTYSVAACCSLLMASCLALPAVAQSTLLDPAFQPPVIMSGPIPGTVQDVVRQADGKYIIGGSFSSINGVRARNLARLNPDGTLDAAFTANSAASHAVSSLALQPDGRILAAGQFDSLAGVARRGVARLLPTGALDVAFDASLPASVAIDQVALLPGGDVLALSPSAPYYNSAGSIAQPTGLRRLSGATGQPVVSFQPGVHALALAVQSDGRIVTGGGNGSYILMHLLARLLPDGRLDTSFTPFTTYFTSGTAQVEVDAADNIYRLGTWNSNAGRGLSGPGIAQNDWGTLLATSFRRQPNGRFLIGGTPMAPNLPLTTRLLPTGQQDGSYGAGSGPRTNAAGSGEVRRFLVQPDGALVMAGSFTLAGSTPVHGLVRLLDASVLATKNSAAEKATAAWPVPAANVLNVSLAPAFRPRQVQLLDAVGRVVLTRPIAASAAALTLEVAALPAGAYALRVAYEQAAPVTRRIVLGQ